MLDGINGDTTISLSTLITLFAVFGTSVAGAAVTLITQGLAIAHIREDVRLKAELDRAHAERLQKLEEWKIRQDALDEAGASTTRGRR